ncbi:MAG: hypothetical protein AAFZ63_10385 [Bacteroidota bacterium]
MRSTLCILLTCAIVTSLSAQELKPTFRFADGVEEDLQQQFTALLYREGCTVDTLSGVMLSLRMSPVQEGMIDGMRRLHTAAYQLYIESRISGSQRILTAEVSQIMSTGTSAEQARRAALMQLQNGTSQLSIIIQKMVADYREAFAGPCHALMADAVKLANNDEPLAALALANAVPADADCYDFAQRQRARYYDQYQEAFCATHLSTARAKLTLEEPKAAVEELAKIDPQSTCASEAQQLLEQAAALLKEQQSAKARFLRQVYQNQVQVEQARNQIISDLVRE